MLIYSALKKQIQKALCGFALVGLVFSPLGARPLAPILSDISNGLSAGPKTQIQTADELQGFAPLSASAGWIRMGSRLYWTADNGGRWEDITPALPSSAIVFSVAFLDTHTGWVLWADSEANGNLTFQSAHTSDGGLTWSNSLLQTLTAEDLDINVENASMDWLDENTGWVSIKRQTGSNFSAGALFHTLDGGRTWVRYVPPIGGPVHFVDRQIGWMAGGPADNQYYKTENGGVTWTEQPLPADVQSGQVYHLYPPAFDSAEHGSLALIALQAGVFEARFYSTADGGRDWTLMGASSLGSLDGTLALSSLDARDLMAAVPNDPRILHIVNGQVETLTNQDGLSAGIVNLQMFSPDSGWAEWNSSACSREYPSGANGPTEIKCTSTTRLIKTSDGGVTWESIVLPAINSDTLIQNSTSTASNPAQVSAAGQVNTQIFIGQGFDVCAIPTLQKLDIWGDYSPYGSVNLYIGGAARALNCDNSPLTASFVTQARAQGWTFIPTWVGPQAPCTTYLAKFSADVNQAYFDGITEANLAMDRLAALGLTTPEKSGSIVYYDLETFVGNATVGEVACREAAKAFMNGWVSQLHLHNNMAGVYGSTLCKYGLVNYWQIPNRPDAIWPAIWDHSPGNGAYSPTASLWNLGCIPNDIWANHERIRQYEGAHNETWGGATINLDNDVIDGVVAIPNQGAVTPPPSASFIATPVSGSVPLTVAFYIVSTANITACSWVYGDGQTGTSCANPHTHVYNSTGSYSVTLTVDGPGGWDDLTRSDYIVVTEPSQPDLVPYPRGSGSIPVVISSITGTSVNDTLFAGQPVFIDWGFKNIGNSNISEAFKVDLFIDDLRIIDYAYVGLGAGTAGGYSDMNYTWNTPGFHTVKLVVDSENSVAESNEENNTWSAQFYWEASLPVGPTTISPSGIIYTALPEFKWAPPPSGSVASYDLYANSLAPGGIVFSYTGIPITRCNGSVCTLPSNTPLTPGDYQFKVGARNYYGIVTYSPWQIFSLYGIPAAPINLSPSGTILTVMPTYSWTKSAYASWYEFHVYPAGSSLPVISETSIPASSSCLADTCTWSPTTFLPRGDYQYQVRAANLSGVSSYSEGTFIVDADINTIYIPLIIQ